MTKPEGIPVKLTKRVVSGETSDAVRAQRRISPEKVLRWVERLEQIKQGASLGPVTAHVHLANACNHECPWCEPGPYRQAHLTNVPKDVAIELAHQLSDLKTKSVLLTGGGEPTVNPAIGDFVSHLDTDVRVSMNTNGGLLHKDNMALLRDLISEGRFDSIRFTLDAFDPETHAKYHKKTSGDNWEQVIRNIYATANAVRGLLFTTTTVNVAILIQDSVEETANRLGMGPQELCRLVEQFTRDMIMAGVTMIQIRPVFEPNEEANRRIHSAFISWVPVWDYVKACLGDSCILNPYSSHMDGVYTARPWHKCHITDLQTTLGANGDAFVCCAMKIKYGKWYENGKCNWADLWLSEARRVIADNIDVFSPACARCSQSAYNDVLFNREQYATELL
jgi:pyruvate-formate lyase-activating enzyme